MIESRNTIGVYYILPGESVAGETYNNSGWYYVEGVKLVGPFNIESTAAAELKAVTEARVYREKKGKI